MADTLTKKVFISVDPEEKQQESIKSNRKKLGVIQKDGTGKENLIGRQRALLNQKLQLDSSTPRKPTPNVVHQHSQTVETGPSHSITEQDLTATEEPSEKYWQKLAESRRLALDDSLRENEGLHNRVRSLEEELDVTNEMLDQARSLVEVLKEMLEEGEEQVKGPDDRTTPPSSVEKGDAEKDSDGEDDDETEESE